MKCTNCNRKLSCGCQQKVASNGTSVCTSCITAYEMSINPNAKPTGDSSYIWDIPKNYYPKR